MKIIGGPAIRATRPDSFHLWIVLDEEAKKIEGFAYAAQSHSPRKAIGRSTIPSQKPVQLGERLFAYMLDVRPRNGSLPRDTKIYYNVYVNGRTLRAKSLFSVNSQITYGGDTLPSLVIPTKHSFILHMSCRKPHGGVPPGRDMTGKLDELLEMELNEAQRRPSMLFATGDQIYADDVAAALLCGLESLALKYTGWQEIVPGPGSKKPFAPGDLKLGNRNLVLKRKHGFTSSKLDNHLITFGEYFCMYLVVLGGLPVALPSYEEILHRIPLVEKRRGKQKVKVPKLTRNQYETERQQVREFLAEAWRLRRALANIPTYCMFDDHEVSDDWNLTEENRNCFRETGSLSRRVQANALAAFWACQGFGNQPAQYNIDFQRTVTNFLTAQSVDGGSDFETKLLEQYWGFHVDGYPVTFVLDTRTQRDYPPNEKFSSLMRPVRISEFGEQINEANLRYVDSLDSQSLLILSAAPVLGFMALERLQLGASFLPNTVDGECWIGSQTAFDSLKKAIASTRFRDCVILSGDVHYAFARKLDLENADRQPLRVFQLTSSAVHNAPNGARRFFLSLLERKDLRKFNREDTPYLFPVGLEHEQFISGENNLGMVELHDGRPMKNTFFFSDSTTGDDYRWEYLLDNPTVVNFD